MHRMHDSMGERMRQSHTERLNDFATRPSFSSSLLSSLCVNVVFHHSNDAPNLHERIIRHVANLLDDYTIDLDNTGLVINSGSFVLPTVDSFQ
jgi:hypothetical protein